MSRRSWLRPARRVSAFGLVFLGACAYFNGIYNAKEALEEGERELRQGREAQAAGSFAIASAKAESVLARYPKSRWRAEALFIAGQGAAYADECDQAATRLSEFLGLAGQPKERRDRATIALSRCLVRRGRYADAREMLEPLTRSKDRDVAAQAAVWAARASISLGENEAARKYLGTVDAGAAQWELASASLARLQYAAAESLIAMRADRGDVRDELAPSLRELWRAGRQQPVDDIVQRYSRARLPAGDKAMLHMLVADLALGAERDSLARAHLLSAQRLSTDTLVDAEASARLALLSLRPLASLVDVENAITRAGTRARSSRLYTRMQDNLLLVRIFETRNDPTGAALFLAAEVARDSLRAPALAHAIFKRVESEHGHFLVAPKALLAAAALIPDSAAAYNQLLRTKYPRAPHTLVVNGEEAAGLTNYRRGEELLRQAWTRGVKVLTDTLLILRPPASSAATTKP